MFFTHHIFNFELANAKSFFRINDKEFIERKTSVSEDKISISEIEKIREERIENFCTLLPLAVVVLGIIIMYILYNIFM